MPPENERSGAYDFLSDIVPEEQVALDRSVREHYATDAGPHEGTLPDAVVWPSSTAEVAAILEKAHAERIPVTPWSGGSGLEGNAIPRAGGIVLNTVEMTDLEVRPADLQAVVQPGIVYDDLNDRLANHGLRFPPGISSGDIATIGGMIATNASGINAIGYGETRDYVLRLEVVLPTGDVIECGRDVIKTSAGYSLKDLFVGSEGTLGVITEATLSLAGIPDRKRAALVTFETNRDACTAVSEIIRYGLQPGAIEFLDRESIRLINAYRDDAVLPEHPLLVIELHGNTSGIDDDLEFVRSICTEHDAVEWTAHGQDEMATVWRARDDALPAYRAYREAWDAALIGDVTVPISAYPAIADYVAEVASELDLVVPCVGHAGDGNLHYVPMVDTTDDRAIDRAFELNDRVVRRAIELGGTATGEHGVGIGKRKFMQEEHGDAVEVMARIKDLFDPRGILNPGKVLPSTE